MKKICKAFSYLVIILLLIGAFGIILKFTNGGTSSFKTFYVQNGKTLYTLDKGNYDLIAGQELKFDVHYMFGFLSSDDTVKDYSVKIIPNVTDDTKFDYTVDGQTYSYAEDIDLSTAFGLEKSDTYFTITIPNDLTMSEVLSQVYDGKTVVVDEIYIAKKYYFALVVTSYNGESSVRINFRGQFKVTGIKLNTDSIIF